MIKFSGLSNVYEFSSERFLQSNTASSSEYSSLSSKSKLAHLSMGDSLNRVYAASPVKNALGERLRTKQTSPIVKLVAVMAGGLSEASTLQPLDVAKTRLQLDKTGKYKGRFSSLGSF